MTLGVPLLLTESAEAAGWYPGDTNVALDIRKTLPPPGTPSIVIYEFEVWYGTSAYYGFKANWLGKIVISQTNNNYGFTSYQAHISMDAGDIQAYSSDPYGYLPRNVQVNPYNPSDFYWDVDALGDNHVNKIEKLALPETAVPVTWWATHYDSHLRVDWRNYPEAYGAGCPNYHALRQGTFSYGGIEGYMTFATHFDFKSRGWSGSCWGPLPGDQAWYRLLR